jgi:hypothetical protein
MTNEARALALRDMALAIVKARGVIENNKRIFDNDHLLIGYQTLVEHHALAIWRRWIEVPLSGGSKARTTKVLNIVWNDAETIAVTYKEGWPRWEQELERLAAE